MVDGGNELHSACKHLMFFNRTNATRLRQIMLSERAIVVLYIYPAQAMRVTHA